MSSTWTTYDMRRDGHAEWIVKTCEKIIAAMREAGGIPSIATTGYLTVSVPTLAEQAEVMNQRDDRAPANVYAGTLVKFLD